MEKLELRCEALNPDGAPVASSRRVEQFPAQSTERETTKTSYATVFYSDLDGFTSLAERLSPREIMSFVQDYFSAATEVIERNRGVAVQYQGDAILATFGGQRTTPDHAIDAVSAAVEFQRLVYWRRFRGLKAATRIGICTGSICSGSLQLARSSTETVHGSTVNLAARLEQLNKEFSTRVLVCQTTANALRQRFAVYPVGKFRIRGMKEPVPIYCVPITGASVAVNWRFSCC